MSSNFVITGSFVPISFNSFSLTSTFESESTSITSIIGYFVERRHALEEFYLETIKLLKRYNKYQTDLTLDKKINFFLELSNYDMEYWGTTYARIDLFNKKSKKYIYEKISNRENSQGWKLLGIINRKFTFYVFF